MASAEVEAVRDWVGNDVAEDDILAALARDDVESTDAAALVILRRRHADLTGSRPGSWGVDGDYQESWRRDQVDAVARKIGRLEALLGVVDPSVPSLTSAAISTPRGTR